MLVVDVLDPKAARYKKTVVKTARWLIKRFKKGGFYVEIVLVGDKTMKKNVYSYPATDFPRPDLKQPALGEIILNPSFIVRETLHVTRYTLNPKTKVEFMLIHGFLHLLGYDHIKKSDRIKMERLERRLLREISNS
ncbi:MAG: rRNA maturation RNase YbeY [bacterium]|nr:rRNA maturation RNase YbeY [bacterium]